MASFRQVFMSSSVALLILPALVLPALHAGERSRTSETPKALEANRMMMQDEIEIDPTTGAADRPEVIARNAITCNSAPGESMKIRDDIAGEVDYTICYYTGRAWEPVQAIEYKVQPVSQIGQKKTITITMTDHRLAFYVNGGQLTHECYHKKLTTVSCLGTGVPVEFYGQLTEFKVDGELQEDPGIVRFHRGTDCEDIDSDCP